MFLPLCIGFILYALIFTPFNELFAGLVAIITGPDILVTDYIYIGGLGAAFLNAGITGLLTIAILAIVRPQITGVTIAILWLAVGFAFFGKNPVNMFPIILGGILWAIFSCDSIKTVINPVLMGTTLAPAVSQAARIPEMPPWGVLGIALAVGLLIGFFITPISIFLRKIQEGYNLYPVGFAAGIMALFIMGFYRNLGLDFPVLGYWSYGHNRVLVVLLSLISVYFIVLGAIAKSKSQHSFKELLHMKAEDKLDFWSPYRECAYFSMGVNGLLLSVLVVLVGGDLTGPTIGGIFTVVGFCAFGKRLLDIWPVLVGAILAAILRYLAFGTYLNDNLIILTLLFATCLAPVTRDFGFKWGIIAGFLHLSLATSAAHLHGGMNLYNNGFTGGLVAMVLLPIIRAMRCRKERNREA